MSLDIRKIRRKFPALASDAIFLDNPAGTQVPRQVVERISAYLTTTNANHGGSFSTSRQSEALVQEARQMCADFVNAGSADEIVFGPNMTSLTFDITRSIAHWLTPGDHLVVTRLDHDANISPWLRIAAEKDCTVDWVDFDTATSRLNLETLEQALRHHPRIVAVGYASNALGTINPVKKIIEMAHNAGALVYVDAVQFAPHGLIDVQALDCDFLVCSAYKFYGPHVGILYGRYDLLDKLDAYKVRPAPSTPPEKFERGTGNFEGIAGVLGALEYLEWIGKTYGADYLERYQSRYQGRRLHLKQAMAATRAYEYELSRALLETIREIPGVHIYGNSDIRKLEERVPTVSFTIRGWHPQKIAAALGDAGIFVWDGNYYALAVTRHLGVEESGGMVRVGAAHYNTVDEIKKFGETLQKIIGAR